MKILLDNCVHTGAKLLFAGHEVQHVLDLGWEALSNGKLLAAATSAGFQLIVTVDKNIRFQQNVLALEVSILELDLIRTRLKDIQAVTPFLGAAIESAHLFRFVSLKSDGTIETLAPRSHA